MGAWKKIVYDVFSLLRVVFLPIKCGSAGSMVYMCLAEVGDQNSWLCRQEHL